jgi:hypothetical protein
VDTDKRYFDGMFPLCGQHEFPESLKVDTTGTAKGVEMYLTNQATGKMHCMSKKLFAEEQVIALRVNPCVERVSRLSVSFTEHFKRDAYRELLSGKPIWPVFKDCGIDTDALGPIRVVKFQQHVNGCAKRGDGFKNKHQRRASGLVRDISKIPEYGKEDTLKYLL